jgi:SAM-dependent methyltransferase
MVMSSSAAIWHELECGSYRADLELWRELSQRSAANGGSARVLDVGAGTGRVALDLGRAGHHVTALDIDPELLAVLTRRTTGSGIRAVCADARTFELARRDFDLCLMPMQTVQLLDGSSGRMDFMRRAHAHLRPGGMLAMAIVTEFEPFDCAEGDAGPSAETACVAGVLYSSRATRVRVLADRVRLERERRVAPEGGRRASGKDAPDVMANAALSAQAEHDVVELHRVDAEQLEREGAAAGLRRAFRRELASTEEHIGATVVVLGA